MHIKCGALPVVFEVPRLVPMPLIQTVPASARWLHDKS
jgi:hypothetical protein